MLIYVTRIAACYRRRSVVGVLITTVNPAKTAEPIEMPFSGRTRVSPRNHALDGRSPGREGTLWGHVPDTLG